MAASLQRLMPVLSKIISFLVLTAFLAGSLPVYAEGPPEFPNGIKPGKRPGIKGDDEDDTVVIPAPSTVGGAAAGIGYVLAGLTTYFAARAIPASLRLAGEALRKFGELGDVIEKWEAAKPGRFAELDKAYQKYTANYAALDNHIEKLIASANQPRGTALALLDDHVAKLLTDIPTLDRAKKGLKDEATALVGEWAKVKGTDGPRPNKPLDEWLRTNDGEYFLKTTKGREWLTEYRRLRDQGVVLQEGRVAAETWKTKGTISDLERWISRYRDQIDGDIIKDWAETYSKLKDQEREGARALTMDITRVVNECKEFFSDPNLKEAIEKVAKDAPKIPYIGIERNGESREPGVFYAYDANGERNGVTRGTVADVAKKQCGSLFDHLQRVKAAMTPMGFWAKGLRLAAPVAAVGLTGAGGYFSLQGAGHVWDRAFPKKDPQKK